MKISVLTPSIRPAFLDITQKTLENQTDQDFEWLVEIGLRNRGFTLPSAWNRLIRECTGSIIFMLQDCIEIPTDAIARIRELDLTKCAYTFPVGKKDGDNVTWDWRKTREAMLKTADITPNMWEADLALASREMFYDIGGFDERFNDGWSWENVEVAWRAEAAGYKFLSSTVTEGIAVDHDALVENPFRGKLKNNDHRANKSAEAARHGQWKLNYL